MIFTNHLKGLDTLRALAATIVVWGHIELIKSDSIHPLVKSNQIYSPNGYFAVVLFYVISGFLITFLMTKEINVHSKISFKKFYLRRILRIWPLYYFIIFLCVILNVGPDYSWLTLLLCLTIFPNIAHAIGEGWAGSPQLWSIGVEEQYYLFWPFIFSLYHKKNILWILIGFIIAFNLAPQFNSFLLSRVNGYSSFGKVLESFFYGSRFDSMAVGSLAGILYASNNEKLKILSNKFIFLLSLIIISGFWFFGFEIKYFGNLIFSLSSVIVIVNVVTHPKINIDTKVTTFLGKISYGIYMYHWLVLIFVGKYLPFDGSLIKYNILFYILTFGITIIISWISFVTFENYFLNLKRRFQVK